MQKIVFDTSFLLSIVAKPTDWEDQLKDILGNYEGIVLLPVRRELELLASKKNKKSKIARVALLISKNFNFVEEAGKADEAIITYCMRNKAIAATTDNELRNTLMRNGVRVIVLSRGRLSIR